MTEQLLIFRLQGSAIATAGEDGIVKAAGEQREGTCGSSEARKLQRFGPGVECCGQPWRNSLSPRRMTSEHWWEPFICLRSHAIYSVVWSPDCRKPRCSTRWSAQVWKSTCASTVLLRCLRRAHSLRVQCKDPPQIHSGWLLPRTVLHYRCWFLLLPCFGFARLARNRSSGRHRCVYLSCSTTTT